MRRNYRHINNKLLVLFFLSLFVVGAVYVYNINAADVGTTTLEDQSGEEIGKASVHIKFLDKNDREIDIKQEMMSWAFNGVEVAKIQFIISYKVTGTNIDTSSVNVQYDYAISHNLDSSTFVSIKTNSLTSTELEGQTTYTLDLSDTFSYFLNNEESQDEHDFQIKIVANFAVSANSNSGQRLVANDAVSGLLQMKWSPDSITIKGDVTYGAAIVDDRWLDRDVAF